MGKPMGWRLEKVLEPEKGRGGREGHCLQILAGKLLHRVQKCPCLSVYDTVCMPCGHM